MRPTRLDHRRSRIPKQPGVNYGFGRDIDCGNAARKAIVDIEALSGLIQRQPGWSLVQMDGRISPDPIPVCVDDDQIIGAHAGDVTSAAIRGPDDGAWIADGFFAFGL